MASWTLSQLYIQNYVIAASIGVVYYDYALTLGDEKRFIWKRSRGPGSWPFFVNRYITLFSTITWLGSFLTWPSTHSCSLYSTYRQVITGVIEFVVVFNMFLRVYALYGKDRRVLALGITVFLVMVGFGVWGFSGDSSPTIVLSPGCHIIISSGKKFVSAWAGLLLSDVLIFTLTFCKTYTAIRGPGFNSNSLSALMFRDGAVYYMTLTCLNLLNLLTFFVLPNALQGCLASLVGNISSIMLSRMMLNLHKGVERTRKAAYSDDIPLNALDLKSRSPASSASGNSTTTRPSYHRKGTSVTVQSFAVV